MPKEFGHLQGQDLNSPRAFSDLISNVEKIIPKTISKQPQANGTQEIKNYNSMEESLIKQVHIFLENGEWEQVIEYCEKILEINIQNAEAYLNMLCAELQVNKPSKLSDLNSPFDNNANFSKIIKYGNKSLKDEIVGYNEAIKLRIHKAALEKCS